MYLIPWQLFFCIFCVLLFGQADVARAIEYEFTRVTKTMNPDGTVRHGDLLYDARISDSGVALFSALGGTEGVGLFSGTSPETTSKIPGRYDLFGIGSSGAIAYFDDTLYLKTDQGVMTIAETTETYAYIEWPLIDDQDNVYFKGSHGDFSNSTHGIYTGPDPLRDVLVDSSGAFKQFGDFKMNSSGDIVFSAMLDSGEIGLFTGIDAQADLFANAKNPSNSNYFKDGQWETWPGKPLHRVEFDLNDQGTIVYLEENESGVTGIYTGPNSETDLVVDTSGAYFDLGRMYLSNDDRVTFEGAYEATDGTQRHGIFSMAIGAEPDPEADAVILWKDEIFDNPLNWFNFHDMNKNGQMLIEYTNGSEWGLAIGSPIGAPTAGAVPEPGAAVLSLLALLGGMLVSRRSRLRV